MPTVLDWALRTYVRPHSDEAECEELETTDAVMEVLEQAEGKVVMDFRMSCSQWAHFEAFFRAEPMGILSAGALGDPHGRISGHAVVIEGSEEFGGRGGLQKTFSTQPVASFDWNADKEGLAVMGCLDQTVRVLMCTKLNLL